MNKKWLLGLALIVLLAGVFAWQWPNLQSWYCVHKLGSAAENERDAWVERVVGLDEAAVSRLLQGLRSDQARECGNYAAALGKLVKSWGWQDPRAHALMEELGLRWGTFSSVGQQGALQAATQLFAGVPPKSDMPPVLTSVAQQLVQKASHDPSLVKAGLELADALLRVEPQGPWVGACGVLIPQGWTHSRAESRALAAQLALHPHFRANQEWLGKMKPLLRDPAADVRRAALLALGQQRELVTEDDLLPLLHDADDEVRRLGEVALRSRGLLEHHIVLARLVSDPRPQARLQVLEHLQSAEDLEPGVWLLRLSQDPCPAVRAAVVRAAATVFKVDLRERLAQMARDDPSPTVRQLAMHYIALPVADGSE